MNDINILTTLSGIVPAQASREQEKSNKAQQPNATPSQLSLKYFKLLHQAERAILEGDDKAYVEAKKQIAKLKEQGTVELSPAKVAEYRRQFENVTGQISLLQRQVEAATEGGIVPPVDLQKQLEMKKFLLTFYKEILGNK